MQNKTPYDINMDKLPRKRIMTFVNFLPKNNKSRNFCRVCLKKGDDMKFLLDSTEESNNLIAKLASILSTKIELGNKYPASLCRMCEKRVENFFQFKEQYNRNNKLLLQCWQDHCNLSSKIIESEQCKNGSIESNATVDHPFPEISSTNPGNISTVFESIDVNHLRCIICNFQCSSAKFLLLHVYNAHSSLWENWCPICNKVDSDLHQHDRMHDKFPCAICKTQFVNLKSIKEHLVRHVTVEEHNGDSIHNVVLPEEESSNKPENSDEDEPKEVSKKSSANQRMRLKQYKEEDVNRVIKTVREKLYKHDTCIFCSFKAASSRTLALHVKRIHSQFKEQWCSSCNEIVKNLVFHLKDVHSDDLKCPFCNKIQTNMGHFMEHMNSHSVNRLHKCSVCFKSFISSRHLRVHQSTHNAYSCKVCDQKFSEMKSLRRHNRTVHKNSSDAYTKNENENNDMNDGNDHFDNPLEGPQNFCRKCSKKVRSLPQHNTRYHSVLAVKQDEKPCLCVYCGKRFKTQCKLTLHTRIHTGEAPYKCQYCDKRLKTRNILVVHERTHTGEKPYACKYCGKRFSQSSILNTHLKIHTGRPEQCTICLKSFCRPAELRLHMRKHTGEKPYICDICDQRFIQKSHLVEHTRRHSDDRPFRCAHCEKSFKNLSTFRSHSQIHTGFKPFKCPQCSYACRQPYSLNKHMKQHENDKLQTIESHKCELCQRSFASLAHLTSHYNRLHSNMDFMAPGSLNDVIETL